MPEGLQCTAQFGRAHTNLPYRDPKSVFSNVAPHIELCFPNRRELSAQCRESCTVCRETRSQGLSNAPDCLAELSESRRLMLRTDPSEIVVAPCLSTLDQLQSDWKSRKSTAHLGVKSNTLGTSVLVVSSKHTPGTPSTGCCKNHQMSKGDNA